jgi:phosphomannomutase
MTKTKTLFDTLTYTPVRSRFGTSGVRALVKDLTDLEVYCLTLGTLNYLQSINRIQTGLNQQAELAIPLAGDLRGSTERLLKATAHAILDAGYQVDYVGRMPTPALSYYALQKGVASFVVTGSHIPADRNGQKANRCDGEVIKSDETGITRAVEAIRQREYSQPVEVSMFDRQGMLKSAYQVELPPVNLEAEQLYTERYRQVFSTGGLAHKRIVFFQYAAVGRDLLPKILENCGAEVICAGHSDEFFPIDTEAISDTHLQILAEIVQKQRAKHGHIDAIVSTDGDSDRPLVVGVNEEFSKNKVSLQFFPGDLLGALVADYLEADSVVVPISVNPAVHEYFQGKGVCTDKTRIGSPYVIAAMQEALDKGKGRVVGWEANGGFLVGTEFAMKTGLLKSLPTRDATLPMLCVLYAAAEQNLPLSQLFERLPKWYGRADLIDDFPQQISQKILNYFSPADAAIKWMNFEKERIVLHDATETVIGEWGYDEPMGKEFLAKKQKLESVFSQDRGFDSLIRINTLDGIRCFFSNGDIAHVRPSGNAPQLRIYAQARSQVRADAIVRMGVAEPDGLLRKLQHLIEGRAAPQQ